MKLQTYMEALDWYLFDTITPTKGATGAIMFREPVSPQKDMNETNMYYSGCLKYHKLLLHRVHVMFLRDGKITPTREWPETYLRLNISDKPYIAGAAWQFAHPLAVLMDLANAVNDPSATKKLFDYGGGIDREILRELAAVYNAPDDLRGKLLLEEQQIFDVSLLFPGGWQADGMKVMVFIEARPFLRPVQ